MCSFVYQIISLLSFQYLHDPLFIRFPVHKREPVHDFIIGLLIIHRLRFQPFLARLPQQIVDPQDRVLLFKI